MRLSDTQLVILTAAIGRDGNRVLPLPEKLRGGAAKTVVDSLIAKGLIAEVDARIDEPFWSEVDGRRITLIATDPALKLLGVEDPEPAASAPGPTPTPATAPASTPRKIREGTKQTLLIEMLKRPEGATIAQIVEATGWQQHTVRGAIAGALKKKLGLAVTSEKVEGRGRVYKLA